MNLFHLCKGIAIALVTSALILVGHLILAEPIAAAQIAQAQTALATLQADHVMLRVPNYQETVAWYEDKLGFKQVVSWKEPSLPGVDLAYLELNGFRVEILGNGDPTPVKPIADPADVVYHTRFQGYRHLCFRVKDVDAVMAELAQRGVKAFAPAFNYAPLQRRLAFVLDNNSNAIEFSGPWKA